MPIHLHDNNTTDIPEIYWNDIKLCPERTTTLKKMCKCGGLELPNATYYSFGCFHNMVTIGTKKRPQYCPTCGARIIYGSEEE